MRPALSCARSRRCAAIIDDRHDSRSRNSISSRFRYTTGHVADCNRVDNYGVGVCLGDVGCARCVSENSSISDIIYPTIESRDYCKCPVPSNPTRLMLSSVNCFQATSLTCCRLSMSATCFMIFFSSSIRAVLNRSIAPWANVPIIRGSSWAS